MESYLIVAVVFGGIVIFAVLRKIWPKDRWTAQMLMSGMVAISASWALVREPAGTPKVWWYAALIAISLASIGYGLMQRRRSV